MEKTQPTINTKCSHPLDKREFFMDGYRQHENGELTDTIIEKEYCTACGEIVPATVEDIIY